MLGYVYWAMIAYFAVLVVFTMYKEKKTLMQVTCGLVLLVFWFRLLGLK